MTTGVRKPSVLIIGAGMSGVLTTIKLRQAGITDITIIEKGDSVGGTWRENTYPGVSCDVPSHMYAYSFEPFVGWDARFAAGPQIRDYFRQVADKYSVTPAIRFNESVTKAMFNNGRWDITTSKADQFTVDFIVCATGILHHPAYPNIQGLEDFSGAAFHTARWDHAVALEGKRVGIIGTGSTACQVIPELVKVADQVKVFQRTPQWIYPRPDADYSERYKRTLVRFPKLASIIGRLWSVFYAQMFARAVIGKPLQLWITEKIVHRYLEQSVPDPELRKKLTPDYRIGCKRLVLSSDFLGAVQAPNCDLVTDAIDHIESEGVVTADGKRHDLDVLVLATGFKHFNFMRPMELIGKNGVDINDAWRDQYVNYRSLTIPDFPNFFLMTGPNSPIGNFSVTMIAEVQVDYLIKVIQRWQQGAFDSIDPKPDAAQRFLQEIKGALGKTVWTGGCQSWYLDQVGTPVLWPWTFERWVKEMREPQWADYHLDRLATQSNTDSNSAPLSESA